MAALSYSHPSQPLAKKPEVVDISRHIPVLKGHLGMGSTRGFSEILWYDDPEGAEKFNQLLTGFGAGWSV